MVEAVRSATRHDLGALAVLARAAIEELEPMKGGGVWVRREGRTEPLDESLRAFSRRERDR